MRRAACRQSRGTLVGFGETARTPRARTAEGYLHGDSEQAAARRRLESVFTRCRLETKRWDSAGSQERWVRHWADRLRSATSGNSAGESSTEAGPRLARRESEQDRRFLAGLLPKQK